MAAKKKAKRAKKVRKPKKAVKRAAAKPKRRTATRKVAKKGRAKAKPRAKKPAAKRAKPKKAAAKPKAKKPAPKPKAKKATRKLPAQKSAPKPLSAFLAKLAADPMLLEEYRRDPDGVMRSQGLSDHEISLMHGSDAAAVHDYLGADGPPGGLILVSSS